MNTWLGKYLRNLIATTKDQLKLLAVIFMEDLLKISGSGILNTLIICITQSHYLLQSQMGSDFLQFMLVSMVFMTQLSIFSKTILKILEMFLKIDLD